MVLKNVCKRFIEKTFGLRLDNFISAGRILSGGGRLDPSWKSVCGRWTSCCHAVVSVRGGLKCIVQ